MRGDIPSELLHQQEAAEHEGLRSVIAQTKKTNRDTSRAYYAGSHMSQAASQSVGRNAVIKDTHMA